MSDTASLMMPQLMFLSIVYDCLARRHWRRITGLSAKRYMRTRDPNRARWRNRRRSTNVDAAESGDSGQHKSNGGSHGKQGERNTVIGHQRPHRRAASNCGAILELPTSRDAYAIHRTPSDHPTSRADHPFNSNAINQFEERQAPRAIWFFWDGEQHRGRAT